MQGGIGFLTRSYLYSWILLLPVCALIKMVKYLFFMQKKENKYGKMVREMDCIHLRCWINRRTTEAQSRHINWFGMYTVNNNKIGTCTSYLSVFCSRDLVLHFLWPSLGDCWLWGSAFLLRVFLLWGSGHLGQFINTPLLFFSHSFF